jgi:hypothetical protein
MGKYYKDGKWVISPETRDAVERAQRNNIKKQICSACCCEGGDHESGCPKDPRDYLHDELAQLVTYYNNAYGADSLRTLRAIINGKLGKRAITTEQQEKMQLARASRKSS